MYSFHLYTHYIYIFYYIYIYGTLCTLRVYILGIFFAGNFGS